MRFAPTRAEPVLRHVEPPPLLLLLWALVRRSGGAPVAISFSSPVSPSLRELDGARAPPGRGLANYGADVATGDAGLGRLDRREIKGGGGSVRAARGPLIKPAAAG